MTLSRLCNTKIGLFIPLLFLSISCADKKDEYKKLNKIEFHQNLSEYDLFRNMSDLIPNKEIIEYKLNATLFTDYALKQRLVKIPLQKKIKVEDAGILNFPEGTIIAKTFYYENDSAIKNILETRLLIKANKVWNVAVYQWEKEQKDAFLITDGAIVNVDTSFTDEFKEVNYKIPSAEDCIMCHKQGNEIVPIGPSLGNLITKVHHNTRTVNRIKYFEEKNLSVSISIDSIKPMVDYNKNFSMNDRARSYFDINCAHCHNPKGFAGFYNINLSYETPFYETHIKDNSNHIIFRMSTKGPVHMPKIGTTLTHREGLELVKKYIDSLYGKKNEILLEY